MMKGCTLAIEWSSRRLSVALSHNQHGVGEEAEEVDRFRVERALGLMDRLLDSTGCVLSEVCEIRVGRGPGNYSGVRQAFAWAVGVAAPGGTQVRAVSSGRAQAFRLLQDHPAGVTILGDARRGMWWGAEFGRQTIRTAEWRLSPPEEWMRGLEDQPVFSGEAERLSIMERVRTDFPAALDILNLDSNMMNEAIEPFYLHPPVG